LIDQIAIEVELADQGVHLAQRERCRRAPLAIAAEESVGGCVDLGSYIRGVLDR
jgi:hypothetical protein